MRPPCSLGRGKENTLIYDSADIELLRFAAAAKNIPPDLQYRLSSRVWDREHIHTVPQFRVEHDQCQLTFYLPGEAGELPNSFKVYYVIGGQEMDACETACTRRDPLGHMVLYIVSSLAQIERLYCNKPFFAALKGGDGRFEFFQGNIQ